MPEKDVAPNRGPKFRRTYSLFPLALTSVLASISIIVSSIVITEDHDYAVIPNLPYDTNFQARPFLQPVRFTNNADAVSSMHLVIAEGAKDNLTAVQATCTQDPLAYERCESVSLLVQLVEPKTLSTGILQHPGAAIVCYAPPVCLLLLCAVVMGFALQDNRILYLTITGGMAFFMFMAYAEFRGPVNILSGFVFLMCTLLIHFIITRHVRSWYRRRRWYMICFWISTVLHIVLAVLATSDVSTRGYVVLQIFVIVSYLPLQLAFAHVMMCMTPLEVGVKLPVACTPIDRGFGTDDDELESLPEVGNTKRQGSTPTISKKDLEDEQP